MRTKACILVLGVACMGGCYANWTGGEDLDGKAREIARSVRYSEFIAREDPVTSPEQDSVRVVARFYYYRQPKTITYKKYFIPRKYISPGPYQYAGHITGAGTALESQKRAEDVLLRAVFGKLLAPIIDDRVLLQDLSVLGANDDETLRSLMAFIRREDASLYQKILGLEISRYSKHVTPEIDSQTLDYLIQRGALERRAAESYHNHAVLIEMGLVVEQGLRERIRSVLYRAAEDARQSRLRILFRSSWHAQIPSLAGKLGPRSGALRTASTPEEVSAGLKLEVVSLNKTEPSIQLQAFVMEEANKVPASQASVLINGSWPMRARADGIIWLDRGFLLTHCLKEGRISAHIQFEILRDLANDLDQRRVPRSLWKESLEKNEIKVLFRYEGRAKVVGTLLTIDRVETGMIFKKLKSVILQGSIKEENFVPVTFKKAIILSTFYNESKRRSVDSYQETRAINLSVSKSASFSLEISSPAFLEKIKKYRSSEIIIRLEGQDGAGNPVVVETKGKGLAD